MQKLSFSFWQSWTSGSRSLFFVLCGVMAFALGALWFTYMQTPAPSIELQTTQEAELSEIPVHHFEKGIFDLSIAGNNYILFERLLGAPLQIPTTGAHFYVIILFASLSILLAVFTTLNRFYYLVCMGLTIFFMVSLRLESLLIFGNADKTVTIAVLAIYVLTSFYFYSFAKAVSFLARVSTFSLISIAFLFVCWQFANINLPLFQLAANGLAAGIIVTVIFIVLVAHELVALFVTLITQGAKTSKSLNHFLVISLIYLVNLALAYAVRFRYLHWSMLTVDLFLLLTLSGVAGIWGIRNRQKQYDGVLDIEPYGVLAYLAMGAVCFASFTWLFQSANDPAIEALSDVIIFTHISYGLIFVLYIISNFGGMLSNNMPVHRVLYNPNNMPYFTFRLGGLIATAAFVIFNNWQVPFQNLIAGYYNAAGDHALIAENQELAKAFYERSANLGYRNHHAHYALANLAGANLNTTKERIHYQGASDARPTTMAILNLTQTYQTEGFDLQALFRIKDGLAVLPDNGALQNTVGYLFMKSGVLDSAQIYFQRATDNDQRLVGKTNLMALSAKLRTALVETDESLLDNPSYRSNLLALQNFLQQPTSLQLSAPTDTVLNRSNAVWINNFLVNSAERTDTTLLNQLTTLARRRTNENLAEPLLFALSLAYYKKGEIQKAYRLLEEVTINGANPGKYNNILALWTLELNEPERALGYIDFALQREYEPAKLTKAVLLAEAGKISESLSAWDSLAVSKDTITSQLVVRMKNLLTLPRQQVFLLSDDDKFAFCHYRVSLADSILFSDILSTVQSPDVKAKILLDRSERYFAMGYTDAAVTTFQKIRGLELTDKNTFERIRPFEMKLLAERKEWGPLEELLQKETLTPKDRRYFEAVLSNAKNDTLKATPLFRWLGQADPFFEEGVIAAADYFRVHGKNSFLPYTLLVEAMQIHPSGVKLRKEYCREAARRGFSDFALSSLETLKQKLGSEQVQTLETEVLELLREREKE